MSLAGSPWVASTMGRNPISKSVSCATAAEPMPQAAATPSALAKRWKILGLTSFITATPLGSKPYFSPRTVQRTRTTSLVGREVATPVQRPDGSCGGFGIPIHDFDLKSTGEKDGAAGLERAVNQHRTIGWIFDDFQQASDRVFIALVFRGEMYVREASAFQRRSHGFYGRCVFSRPQIDHRSDAMPIRNFKQFFRRYLFGLIELIRVSAVPTPPSYWRANEVG